MTSFCSRGVSSGPPRARDAAMRNAPASRSIATTSGVSRRAASMVSECSASFGATALIESTMPSTKRAYARRRVTLLDYGWDDTVAALAREAHGVVGRVIRIDRGVYTVRTDDGERAASLSGALKDTRDPVDRP